MNHEFGLRSEDLKMITRVLEYFPEIEEALIFGSRAIGNYRRGSDVDIALKGNELQHITINKVSFMLNEETPLPYRFDVLNYNTLSSADLKNHIDTQGIVFYHPVVY